MNFTRCTPATYQGGEGVKLLRNFTLHPAGSPSWERSRFASSCLPRAWSRPIGPDNGVLGDEPTLAPRSQSPIPVPRNRLNQGMYA